MFRTRVIVVAALLPFALTHPASAQGFLDRAMDVLRGADEGSEGSIAATLSNEEVTAGLRSALRVATSRAVERVSAVGGFNDDPAIHIPLPEDVRRAQSILSSMGFGAIGDQVELKLNRAAEAAAPEAKTIFVDAITGMTLEDARAIYDGPEDAATQYFRGKMSGPLADRMTPIVSEKLGEVGAIQTYDQMMAPYRDIPFAPDVRGDLTTYAVEKALDGIFHYVAEEEARIRSDPAARSTELLKKVFGG